MTTESNPTSGADMADATPPEAREWMSTRPPGFALEFDTWLDADLIQEKDGLQRRRLAASGLPAGVWIGGGSGALAALTAFWLESHSRWVAIFPERSWMFAENGRPFLPVLALALGFLALGLVGRWLEESMGARAAAKARARRELLAKRSMLRLDSAGVSVIGDGFESRYDWSRVDEVRAGKAAVWLFIGADAVPAPRSSVGGPVEVEALMTRIEAFREGAAES